jgi:hypothetical protein
MAGLDGLKQAKVRGINRRRTLFQAKSLAEVFGWMWLLPLESRKRIENKRA